MKEPMVIRSVDDLGKGVHMIVLFEGRLYSRAINTTQTWSVEIHMGGNKGGKAYGPITDQRTIAKLDKAFSKAVFYGRQA